MQRMMMLFILAMLGGACSPGKPAGSAAALTEAQRDSVLARSQVPGASAIGRAQGASGVEAGHAAGVNAMVDSLPR